MSSKYPWDDSIREWIMARKDDVYFLPLSSLPDKESDTFDQILMNHLPTSADPWIWKKVCDFSVQVCSPASSSDCRPGRLYALSDEQIEEAQAWLESMSYMIHDPTEPDIRCPAWHPVARGMPDDLPDWEPGRLMKVTDEETGLVHTLPVAAYLYICAAFPQ